MNYIDRYKILPDRFIPTRSASLLDETSLTMDQLFANKQLADSAAAPLTFGCNGNLKQTISKSLLLLSMPKIQTLTKEENDSELKEKQNNEQNREEKQKHRKQHLQAEKLITYRAPGLVDNIYYSHVHWSASGNMAVAFGNRVAQVSPLASSVRGRSTPTPLLRMETSEVTGVRYNPFYDVITVTTLDGLVLAADIAGSNQWTIFSKTAFGGHVLGWSHTVPSLFAHGGVELGVLYVHDLRSGAFNVLEVGNDTSMLVALSWAPTGNQFATGDVSGRIHIFDSRRSDQKLLELVQGPNAPVNALDWSPKSTLLVSNGDLDSSKIHIWDTVGEGKMIHKFPTPPGITGVVWNKLGDQILTTHGRLAGVPVCSSASKMISWHAKTGKMLCDFGKESNQIVSVSMSQCRTAMAVCYPQSMTSRLNECVKVYPKFGSFGKYRYSMFESAPIVR